MNNGPQDTEIKDFGEAVARNAMAAGWRRVLLVSGTREWCHSTARTIIDGAHGGLGGTVWAAREPPPEARGCDPAGLVKLLGTEAGALVIDTRDGLDPDGLGAAAGTVTAGGLILLLTPPLSAWPDHDDPELARLAVDGYDVAAVGRRFTRRLAAILSADPWTVVLTQGERLPAWVRLGEGEQHRAPDDPDCISDEQLQAVDSVLRTATGHRRRPTVLTADRGRGKSAALGIAAARFLRERGGTVVVTGPRRAAAEAALDHAARCLGVAVRRARVDAPQGGCLRFMVPEDIRHCDEVPALVLVDEAAALSPAMLADLLRAHSRIVFATTVHGYEGSGRGFVLRFQPVLDAETPHWRHVHLTTPIRWRAGDPVEALLFRSLLLDADLPQPPRDGVYAEQTRVETLDRDALASDQGLLRDVFGLLVHAHYRTRPMDLRNLLDGPSLSVVVLRVGDRVVGVALVGEEGGFDVTLARAIWSGVRRPRGHLLAQTLACHVGVLTGACARGLRVMRIAVHPALQRRGLGRHLLDHLVSRARDGGYDLIGASFGATEGLLGFWRDAGFLPVRLGMRRDVASGTHSALVVAPLSDRGGAVFNEARSNFSRDFPAQLGDPLSGVEPQIVLPLLRGLQVCVPQERDWLDTVGFACGQRAYEVTLAALQRVALASLSGGEGGERLTPEQCQALVARLIQHRSWADAARIGGQAGRPALIALLQAAFRRALAREGPDSARRLARQME